jgi:hypothetical protein
MVPYVSLLQYVPQQDAAAPRETRKLYLPYVGKNIVFDGISTCWEPHFHDKTG